MGDRAHAERVRRVRDGPGDGLQDTRVVIQPKLPVGSVTDPLEAEGDQVIESLGRSGGLHATWGRPTKIARSTALPRQGSADDVVRRKLTEPTDVERLEKYYRSECEKFKLSPDDPVCREILQGQIDNPENTDVAYAETMIGSSLFMLALGGHSNLGQDLAADATKKDALARNHAEQERFRRIITEGADSSPTDEEGIRWRNTCRWIVAGHGGIKVYSVTLAHDTAMRGASKGIAWFFPDESLDGTDVLSNKRHDYPDDVTSFTNLNLGETKGTEAGTLDGKVIFYASDRMSDEHIERTLVHELQHVADRSADAVKYWEGVKNHVEKSATRYKTEFRAHWYEGTFDDTPTDPVHELGYEWTARQWEIFQKIYDGYTHTRLAWDFSAVTDWTSDQAELTVAQQDQPLGFQQYINNAASDAVLDDVDRVRLGIVQYQHPDAEGANKFNSIAIDQFYNVLDGKEWDQQPTEEWDRLKAAWRKLDDDERAFINQSGEYTRFGKVLGQLQAS